MGNLHEFKDKNGFSFKLEINDFDYIDFIWLSEEVLPCIYGNDEFVMKTSWISAISKMENIKISYSSEGGSEVFVSVSPAVMSNIYKKNKMAPQFVVNKVISFALQEVVDAKENIEEGEKKS